jgi:toxin ParE1/3/4
MKVHWTDESLAEIEAIVAHIAEDNATAALSLADTIFDRVEAVLPDNPKAGRPGRVEGTRELVVHSSYIVAYRVSTTAVDILTVRHAARVWPDTF